MVPIAPPFKMVPLPRDEIMGSRDKCSAVRQMLAQTKGIVGVGKAWGFTNTKPPHANLLFGVG